MNERHEPDHDDDPRDRLLEAMLPQALDGSRVPDLRARVVARLAERQRGTVPSASNARPRGSGLGGWGLGALWGAAAAGLLAWLFLGSNGAARAVPLRIADGCVTWQHGDVRRQAQAGEQVAWPLSHGDRLRVCDGTTATCDVAALGRLHMARNTEIEVRNMQWKDFSSGAALGALTVAVVSGAIHWTGASGEIRAGAGGNVELSAGSGSLAAASQEQLQRQLREVEGELLAARTRVRELEAQAARTAAVANAPPAAAATEVAKKLAPGITYTGMDPVLAAIDWDITGECMHAMTARMDEILAALEAGKEMPFELVGEIQKLNGELIKQAAALVEAKVPGSGANGVFTNPVIAANQMYATLAKAGAPLDEGQREALQKLSAQVASEDDARRGALGSDGFALEDVLGETALKDRFYAEARRLMTPEQERALFPGRLQGRGANLFGTGLIWAQYQSGMRVTDKVDFGSQVAAAIAKRLQLDEQSSATLRTLTARWASGLPDAVLDNDEPMSGTGFDRTGNVAGLARQQLALMRELDRSLPLDAKQRETLRKARGVFVPRRGNK